MSEQSSWHAFYGTAFWQRRRQLQLREHPLCKFCLERGVITKATVADHVQPHKGDWNKFCLGELQSLCTDCHNSSKRYVELRGYRMDIGDDGWPLDPNHPANRHR
ncbi:HNH endonuclease [Bradyrhizobium neotropicale]|uniref:HNH endonuclease n=1 Tax=Bradyrhizobium neotropicale TaxID=1497615 RepID=UPI001AD7B266|nr:HNH endonuclease [Bradyrhizobium neotropicale]